MKSLVSELSEFDNFWGSVIVVFAVRRDLLKCARFVLKSRYIKNFSGFCLHVSQILLLLII